MKNQNIYLAASICVSKLRSNFSVNSILRFYLLNKGKKMKEKLKKEWK